jgi:large-conductance mechanosensitive channel
MTSDFQKWVFVKQDLDSLLITFLITTGVTSFINGVMRGVFTPILNSMWGNKGDSLSQKLVIRGIHINFKIQYLIDGLVQLMMFVLTAYVVFRMFR